MKERGGEGVGAGIKVVVSPIWPSLSVDSKDKFVSALSIWGDDELSFCSVVVATG